MKNTALTSLVGEIHGRVKKTFPHNPIILGSFGAPNRDP
jgi:hypothetical protein